MKFAWWLKNARPDCLWISSLATWSYLKFHNRHLKRRYTIAIKLLMLLPSIGIIWYSRNAVVIFRGAEFDIQKVVELIQIKSWSWLKAKIKGFSYSLIEWKTQPLSCLEII